MKNCQNKRTTRIPDHLIWNQGSRLDRPAGVGVGRRCPTYAAVDHRGLAGIGFPWPIPHRDRAKRKKDLGRTHLERRGKPGWSAVSGRRWTAACNGEHECGVDLRGKNLLGGLGERQGDSRSTLVGLVQRRKLYRRLASSSSDWVRRSFDGGALRRLSGMRREPGVLGSLYRG